MMMMMMMMMMLLLLLVVVVVVSWIPSSPPIRRTPSPRKRGVRGQAVCRG
jgi:hypothetical protein